MLKHICPKCSKLLKAPEKLAGQKIKCPHCEARSILPSLEPEPVPNVEDSPFADPSELPNVKQQGRFMGMQAVVNEEIDEGALTGGDTYYGDETVEVGDGKKLDPKLLTVACVASFLVLIVGYLLFGPSKEPLEKIEEPLAGNQTEEISQPEMKIELGEAPDQVVELPVIEPAVVKETESAKQLVFPKISNATLVRLVMVPTGEAGVKSLSPSAYGGTYFALFKFNERLHDMEYLKSAVLRSNSIDYLPSIYGVKAAVPESANRYNPKEFKDIKYTDGEAGLSEGVDVVGYAVSGGMSGVGYFHFPTLDASKKSELLQWRYEGMSSGMPPSYIQNKASYNPTSAPTEFPAIKSVETVTILNGISKTGRPFQVGNTGGNATHSSQGNYVVIVFTGTVKGYSFLRYTSLNIANGLEDTRNLRVVSRPAYFGVLSENTFVNHPESMKRMSFESAFSGQTGSVNAIAYRLNSVYTGKASLRYQRGGEIVGSKEFTIKPYDKNLRQGFDVNKYPVAQRVNYGSTTIAIADKGGTVNKVRSIAVASPRASLPAAIGDEKITGVETTLPHPASEVVGVGDNKLVLFCKGETEFQVYNMEKKVLGRRIKVPRSDVVFGVGGNVLVVYMKSVNLFYVYDTRTGDKITQYKNPYKDTVYEIIMGSAVSDRCLVVYGAEGARGRISEMCNVPGTVRASISHELDFYSINSNRNSRQYRIRADAHLNKVIFASSSSTFYTVKNSYFGMWSSEKARGPSSAYVVRPCGGLCVNVSGYVTDEKGAVVYKTGGDVLLPLEGLNGLLRLEPKTGKLSIQSIGSVTSLVDIGVLPSPDNDFRRSDYRYTIDRRLHYDPISGDLVYLQKDGRRIFHAECSVEALFKDVDYIFAKTPSSLAVAEKGSEWEYEVGAKHSGDDFTMEAVTLPQGMKVDGKKLTWSVPHGADSEVLVEVNLKSGKASTKLSIHLRSRIKTTVVEAELPADLRD